MGKKIIKIHSHKSSLSGSMFICIFRNPKGLNVVFPQRVPRFRESWAQYQKTMYSKTCVKRPLSKRPKIVFQDLLSLNAGQKYCQWEHSAILSTFIKLPFVIKIFVLSIFDCLFYTGLTVLCFYISL